MKIILRLRGKNENNFKIIRINLVLRNLLQSKDSLEGEDSICFCWCYFFN
jgi:hypothetical protein